LARYKVRFQNREGGKWLRPTTKRFRNKSRATKFARRQRKLGFTSVKIKKAA